MYQKKYFSCEKNKNIGTGHNRASAANRPLHVTAKPRNKQTNRAEMRSLQHFAPSAALIVAYECKRYSFQ
jgi:hypothetical protein